MTNSVGTREVMNKRCPGYHRHCVLDGVRPRQAQKVAFGLRDGLLKGTKLQQKLGDEAEYIIASVGHGERPGPIVPDEGADYENLIH